MRRFPLVFFLILFSSIGLITAPKGYSSEEFETDYQVRYAVNPRGVTQVTQEISLTNKLSQVYATRYSLTTEIGHIQNVVAEDSLGPLATEVKEEGKTTIIDLTFNEQVVGSGKSLKFSLKYETLGVASKNGQVWEITLPKLSHPEEINSYSLSLTVPKSFGELAYITPQPASKRSDSESNIYFFNKGQLGDSGGVAVFGDFQVFDFTLFYHLKNPEMVTGETSIALPPDTAYQKVIYKTIDPPPLNVKIDVDGNWLASYRLAAKEKLTIKASGQVKIYTHPQEHFPIPTQSALESNLKPDVFWETEEEIIKSQAENLATPQDIYNFVIENLDYDYSRVKRGAERLGALESLKNPDKAICTEFTDLFVALSRAAGYPAREINGFAYATNEKLRPLSLMADVLHAWPEYWDEEKQIWVPVDPTWGKTTGGIDYFSKLDLSHFAFVTHGADSETPYPAGAYKLEESIQKDIQVAFGTYAVETPVNLEVSFDLPKSVFAGFESAGEVIVKNSGSSALYNLPIEINSAFLNVDYHPEEITILPPFASQVLAVRLKNQTWLKSGQGTISILINNEKFDYHLEIKSLIWHQIIPAVIGSLMGVFLFLTIYKAAPLLIRKIRRPSA